MILAILCHFISFICFIQRDFEARVSKAATFDMTEMPGDDDAEQAFL